MCSDGMDRVHKFTINTNAKMNRTMYETIINNMFGFIKKMVIPVNTYGTLVLSCRIDKWPPFACDLRLAHLRWLPYQLAHFLFLFAFYNAKLKN